jgi:hypothetical protein
MRFITALILASLAGTAAAKLPPPSAEAKALSAETAAKAAWTDKVGLYQLCQSMDRTAEAYRKSLKGEGKTSPAPTTTAACVDPGPYVSQTQVTPAASKPLEASGAHSPPGAAVSPPSTNKTQAEISKSRKP